MTMRPCLFTIFVNDLNSNIHWKILKFADDSKLYNIVNNDEDKEQL